MVTTNDYGNATFPHLPDGCQLWVTAPNHAECELAIPAAPQRDVVLPRGEVVSGTVLVGGQAPEEPIELVLWADGFPVARPAAIPEMTGASRPTPNSFGES